MILESIAVVSMLLSVWLAARQNVFTWPLGILGVLCFGFVFWSKAIYGAAILQVFYLLQSLWGWYTWENDEKRVRRINQLDLEFGVEMTIWSIGLAYLLLIPLQAASPALDAVTFALSLFATYLLTYRYVETWYVWILTNAIYAFLFVSQDLYLTAALSCVLIGVNLYALRSWKRQLASV